MNSETIDSKSLGELPQLPPRISKQRPRTWILTAFFVFFLVWSARGADVSLTNFIAGMPNIWRFLSEAFPPDASRFGALSKALLETFQMALVGTCFGVFLSLPLGILAAQSQNPNWILRTIARNIIALFRTIPELVWALIFVVSVGLGPFAGTLTIMIDTVGFCGRFFAEAMEEVDSRPQEALKALGASRLSVIVCSVLPGAFPSFVNTTLYALEKATRSSVVLGLVGAGGIGLELKVAMDMFRYDQAAMIILCMFVIVTLVERGSVMIRKRVI